MIKKKNILLITSVIFLLAILILPIFISSSESEYITKNIQSQYSYESGYYINSYDINMVVNENNTLLITENIGVYFNQSKHGIFRKIPINNIVVRQDGTKSHIRTQISDINVNNQFNVYKENGYTVIKIGNPNKYVSGQKNYEISYLYNLGKDKEKNYDELYFNLIGYEWETSIENVSFTISMPKEFDSSKLGFASGSYGETEYNVEYTINENVISGIYTKKINPGEALTVRLELPEGYFVGAGLDVSFVSILAIILPIVFLIITFILWRKFGKDEKHVETIEFYPPAGFNSTEVAYLYKGKVEDKDIVSLLIYLANKGYIKIVEDENGVDDAFKIIKLKDYDGDNYYESQFMSGLFKRKTKTPEVTLEELKYEFYKTIQRIRQKISSRENREKIFYKTNFLRNFLIVLMIITSYLLISVEPIMNYDPNMLPFGLLFPAVGFIIYFILLKQKSLIPKIFGTIWFCGFSLVPFAIFVIPAILNETIYIVAYLLGISCTICMIILLSLMPKRNQYGLEMLGKISGFRTFLEQVEKDKIEALINENPTYFYDILPYAYVLNVSDKWIKKFEVIAVEPPDWYEGHSTFTITRFGYFVDSTMSSATRTMSATPSSSGSSGGGFSGGGFSGGGSGGGGGGAW